MPAWGSRRPPAQRGRVGTAPRANSMSFAMFQVLLASSTLPESAPPPPPPTLLHIGGHHAEEAKEYAEQGFSNRVVFIEAIPAAHSVCERVAARHGQACVNALLWDVDGMEHIFHVTTDNNGRQWSSSVFELTTANNRWREDQRPRPFAQMQLKSHRFDTLAAQYPSVLGRTFTHLVRCRSNPQSGSSATAWLSCGFGMAGARRAGRRAAGTARYGGVAARACVADGRHRGQRD